MPGNSQYEMPISDTYLNEQIARVSAALPAAGAWDAAPLELGCATFDSFTLFCLYTPDAGGAANAFDVKVEVSRDGVTWYQSSLYDTGVMVVNTDIISNIQREIYRYGATQQVVAEGVVIGPIVMYGSPDFIRITAREAGDVGDPGTLEIRISFK